MIDLANTVNTIDISRIKTQQEFIYCKERFQCYSGGFRSGKTWAMLIKVLLLARTSNNRIFVGRLDGKDLRLSTMRDLFQLLPKAWIESKNDQLGFIKLLNGTEIIYGDLKDLEGKKGLTFGVVAIDQGEEINQDIWNWFKARLALPVPKQYMLMTCNPEGHNWIWHMFKKHKIDNHALFEGTPFDNPFLPPDYIPSLLNSGMPDYWIRRYVYGSWEAFSEQVYPQFDIDIHMIDEFMLPPEWMVCESLDHGLSSPTSCHQYAQDYDGNIFVPYEHYLVSGDVSLHAKSILNNRKGTIATSYADPTIFNKNQTDGKRQFAVADLYSTYGIHFVPYNNNWALGYNRMCQYLMVDPNHRHPITQKLGAPRFYVFKSCVNMKEEFINYKWKKTRSKISGKSEITDEPVDANDHALDECRGFVATRPEPPKPGKAYSVFSDDYETPSKYDWMTA